MGMLEDSLEVIRKATSEWGLYENPSQLALAVGEEPNLISRWLSGKRVPKMDKLGKVLDHLGVALNFPGLPTRQAPGPIARAVAEHLRVLAHAHKLSPDELGAKVWPDDPDATTRCDRVLAGREPLTLDDYMALCAILLANPGDTLERVASRADGQPVVYEQGVDHGEVRTFQENKAKYNKR